jgi:hypothetical protein
LLDADKKKVLNRFCCVVGLLYLQFFFLETCNFQIIIISSYLLGLTMLIWQSLPGWGRFMLNIQTAKGPQYIQVREYKNLDVFFIQTDIEQGLMVFSLILYLWCLIDIIYQVMYLCTNIRAFEFKWGLDG